MAKVKVVASAGANAGLPAQNRIGGFDWPLASYSCPIRTLIAPIKSMLSECPHSAQTRFVNIWRFSLQAWPQCRHVLEVFFGARAISTVPQGRSRLRSMLPECATRNPPSAVVL